MPANLTPQYLEAERRYKQAASTLEKIAALEEMMALIPKHKGTEKLQADLKSRYSKLRSQHETVHGKSGLHRLDTVEPEGAGQVLLIGAPNCGKSSLIASVTHATPEVADYPFTTRAPIPGMMPYENIKIQLVEMPAISEEFWQPRFSGIVRNADMILLLADLSTDEILDQIDVLLRLLAQSKIELGHESLPPDAGGNTIRKTLMLATKTDLDPLGENHAILREYFGDRFEILPISSQNKTNLEVMKVRIYDMLGIIRLYSKAPGKKAEYNDPFVLKKGSTVLDAAAHVHKDFAQKLRFAKIWGSGKHDGILVNREHVLQDGDVIEFHI